MVWARLSKSLPCSWSLLKETALQKGLPLGARDHPHNPGPSSPSTSASMRWLVVTTEAGSSDIRLFLHFLPDPASCKL